MKDYKKWIQNRAEELALERYGKEYLNLPSNLQEAMHFIATRDYRSLCAMKLGNILKGGVK